MPEVGTGIVLGSREPIPISFCGAGKDDPTLPIYAGAVPPKGTPAWDWDKTWRWRMKKTHRADAESAEKKP